MDKVGKFRQRIEPSEEFEWHLMGPDIQVSTELCEFNCVAQPWERSA